MLFTFKLRVHLVSKLLSCLCDHVIVWPYRNKSATTWPNHFTFNRYSSIRM